MRIKTAQKRIVSTAFIVDSDPKRFDIQVGNNIEELQDRGQEVEVQYQVKGNSYTALIIGREVQ